MTQINTHAAIGSPGLDYCRQTLVTAPTERVFAAITTLDGLGGWWTPLVGGDPAVVGGEVRFEFEGLDEHILMRVDELRACSWVSWSCLLHSSFPEWDGTQIEFELRPVDDASCELTLRHLGLAPEWDYFLESLVAYAEHGTGTPYGAGRPGKERR